MSRLQSDARVTLEAGNKWSHDQSTAWAAVVVQRALRTRWQVYSLFGPELFVDSRGAAGQCGAIAFPGGSKVAFWIKDFTLPTELRLAFDQGLAKASHFAKALIISAGSDAGIMKLTGAARPSPSPSP
ncbi:MAG: hypothetical protein SGPRY_004567 [Prymnesium sp.]